MLAAQRFCNLLNETNPTVCYLLYLEIKSICEVVGDKLACALLLRRTLDRLRNYGFLLVRAFVRLVTVRAFALSDPRGAR